MKELPDEKKMLEMLEVFKESEEKAKEMCEFATDMALKYQRKIREASPANSRQVSRVE
jgi:hypothetical protein